MSVLIIGLSIGVSAVPARGRADADLRHVGVINFAHGAFYMLGAYLTYQTGTWTGSFWLALVVQPLIVAALAAAMEYVAMRRSTRVTTATRCC